MAYTLSKSNNQVVLTLTDGTGDGPSFPTKTTSINFIGKNYSNFGDAQNESFLWLLENFANNTPPINPLTGQIWFNTSENVFRPAVFDGATWKNLAILQYSNTTTNTLINSGVANYPGDMWFDSTTKQLYVITSTTSNKTLIGPESVPGFGTTKMSSTVMYDTLNGKHPVIQATVDGEIIGVISSSTFSSNNVNFSTVYRGLTLHPTYSQVSATSLLGTAARIGTIIGDLIGAYTATFQSVTSPSIFATSITATTVTVTALTTGAPGTTGSLTGQWKLTAGSNIAPTINLANDLGTTALKFNNIYANNISASSLTGPTTVNGVITPFETDSQNFGASNLRWNNIYTKLIETETVNTTAVNATTVTATTLRGALAVSSMVDTLNNTITRFDVDGTFANNSDSILPSQKSIKTYVDTAITTLSNSLQAAIAALQNQLANVSSVVAGTVFYTANSVVPNGYLLCNGALISTTTYADLFAAIGYTYGGSGATFRLPDLRGEFIRGLDSSRGVDAGRTLGSFQDQLVISHNHSITLAGDTTSAGDHNHTVSESSHRHEFNDVWLIQSDGPTNFTNLDGSQGWPARDINGVQDTGNPQTSPSYGAYVTPTWDNNGDGGVNDNALWTIRNRTDSSGGVVGITAAPAHTHGVSLSGTTLTTGGSETRPRNVALTPIIKT